MKPARLPALSALVFSSGWCALVYQIGWLRELRLVFGASTRPPPRSLRSSWAASDSGERFSAAAPTCNAVP